MSVYCFESSAKVNGVILPIIAFSLPLAQVLAILGVPQGFVYSVTSLTESPAILILMMVAILVIAGCVMEATRSDRTVPTVVASAQMTAALTPVEPSRAICLNIVTSTRIAARSTTGLRATYAPTNVATQTLTLCGV